jgi:hypothetical protein
VARLPRDTLGLKVHPSAPNALSVDTGGAGARHDQGLRWQVEVKWRGHVSRCLKPQKTRAAAQQQHIRPTAINGAGSMLRAAGLPPVGKSISLRMTPSREPVAQARRRARRRRW